MGAAGGGGGGADVPVRPVCRIIRAPNHRLPADRAAAVGPGLRAGAAGAAGGEEQLWTLAEAAGHKTPDRMQRLLNRAAWDDGGVRDDARGYVTRHLTEGPGAGRPGALPAEVLDGGPGPVPRGGRPGRRAVRVEARSRPPGPGPLKSASRAPRTRPASTTTRSAATTPGTAMPPLPSSRTPTSPSRRRTPQKPWLRPRPGHARGGPPSTGTPDHSLSGPRNRLGLVGLTKTPPAPGQNQPLPAEDRTSLRPGSLAQNAPYSDRAGVVRRGS